MESIRELRQKAGLTQKELSVFLGIPLRTLESWERGVRQCPEWADRLVREKMIHSILELRAEEIMDAAAILKEYLDRDTRKALIWKMPDSGAEEFFDEIVRIYVENGISLPKALTYFYHYNDENRHRFWRVFCRGLV